MQVRTLLSTSFRVGATVGVDVTRVEREPVKKCKMCLNGTVYKSIAVNLSSCLYKHIL